MRTMILALFCMALVLSASMVFAQGTCSTCPSAEPACPTCPAPCPPVKCASPGIDVGEGPASQLSELTCPDFDKAYVRLMYQQNADIIALTTYGKDHASNSDLRGFSKAVMHRYEKYNRELGKQYAQITCVTCPAVDAERIQSVITALSAYCGCEFDNAYVNALSGMLQQSKDAASMAIQKTANEKLRTQARDVVKLANKDLGKTESWQKVGFLTWNDYNRFCSANVGDARCQ